MEVTARQLDALRWLSLNQPATHFPLNGPDVKTIAALIPRGFICDRKLIPHPNLNNVAIAQHRLTALGRACLRLNSPKSTKNRP